MAIFASRRGDGETIGPPYNSRTPLSTFFRDSRAAPIPSRIYFFRHFLIIQTSYLGLRTTLDRIRYAIYVMWHKKLKLSTETQFHAIEKGNSIRFPRNSTHAQHDEDKKIIIYYRK